MTVADGEEESSLHDVLQIRSHIRHPRYGVHGSGYGQNHDVPEQRHRELLNGGNYSASLVPSVDYHSEHYHVDGGYDYDILDA
mmetsp:Transcript_44435/g.49833  ORF Transcript_44435/g.49833 Transcript_44435/m.49833 type:complete len:83 (-) Transcript_44435:1158-1406(-)